MSYENHKFCWHGIMTPDTEVAKTFYAKALGWSVQTVPMGDGEATLFAPSDNIPRLHLGAPPEDGIAAQWQNFLKVEDVDAMTAKAIANGGAQLTPPTDIAVGRFSIVTSPSGAPIHLFTEANASSTNAPSINGGIHWTELHSHEVEQDLAWLTATFGFTTEVMPMPSGDYYLLQTPQGPAGGVTAAQQPGAPSMWLTWVRVEDVDATSETVTQAGGSLLSEKMEVPGVGAMAIAADPTGAVFGIITPPAAA